MIPPSREVREYAHYGAPVYGEGKTGRQQDRDSMQALVIVCLCVCVFIACVAVSLFLIF
jgi:hypothetical protein